MGNLASVNILTELFFTQEFLKDSVRRHEMTCKYKDLGCAERERDRQTDRQTDRDRERQRQRETERDRDRTRTLFYKDCSLGQSKTCLTTSPC